MSHESRPEWVKCIQRQAMPAFSLCGLFAPTEWKFVDREHARLSEEQGGRLVACEECKSWADDVDPSGGDTDDGPEPVEMEE